MKAYAKYKQGDFSNSNNGRVSDKLIAELILFDCFFESEIIRVELWQNRINYFCSIKIKLPAEGVNLESNARGESAPETIKTGFSAMGITWSIEPRDLHTASGSTDVEIVFEAIGREIGAKKPKIIRAGYHQPIRFI
jgi:hypothetical protein